MQEMSQAVRALRAEMKAAGVYVFLGGLDSSAPVFSVDATSGRPIFTDGPYTETKEHLGGFTIIDVPDEEAARMSAAQGCSGPPWPHEVRRLQVPRQPAEARRGLLARSSSAVGRSPGHAGGLNGSAQHFVIEEVVMVRGYRWLTAADEDEIWDRLRAGHAAKPTARALGLPTGTVRAYLVRCGGIRPVPRRRAPVRLSLAGREEISRGLGSWHIVTCDRGVSGSCPVDGQSRGRRSWRPGPVPGRTSRSAGLGVGQASAGIREAATSSGAACDGGREAPTRAVVTSADRRLAEDHPPDDPEMQVSHETIYRTLFIQSRGALRRGADRSSAHRASDPTPRRGPDSRMVVAAGPGSSTSPNDQPRPSTGPSRALGGRPGLRQRMSRVATLVERSTRFVMLVATSRPARWPVRRYRRLPPAPGH